jgi:hypothetical protein
MADLIRVKLVRYVDRSAREFVAIVVDEDLSEFEGGGYALAGIVEFDVDGDSIRDFPIDRTLVEER